MFEGLGRFVHRRRWLVLIGAGLALALAIAVLVGGGKLSGGTIRDLESEYAQLRVEEVIGHPPDTTWIAVFTAKKRGISGAELRAAVGQALAPLERHPAVLSVSLPREPDDPLAARMVNASAGSAFALVTLRGTLKEALHVYPELRALLRSDQLDVACTGRIPFLHDLGLTLSHDLRKAELVSLPLALIVLLFVFRTAAAAALPVGVGALAVASGIAVVFALSHYVDVAEYTVSVCSLIGLGVAIDYSLFMVSRYREELAAGRSYEAALSRALDSAGRVVAFSGAAVVTGLSGLLFFEGSYLRSMGIGGAIVVALAVLFALTFLPALLAVLGPKVHAGRLPVPRLKSDDGFWYRTATRVMRHPISVLVPTLAVLLFIGIPFLGLRMTSSDVRVLPSEVEARRGYELLRQHFPEQAQNRILIAVEFPTGPALTPDRVGALVDLSRSIAELPGVSRMESLFDVGLPLTREAWMGLFGASSGPSVPAAASTEHAPPIPPHLAGALEQAKRQMVGARVVLMHALTDLAPESEEARSLVRSIRQNRRVADGALLVGGSTANDIDTTAYISERAPKAVAWVCAITLLVLFLLLGSVLLPLKAVLMNFVSIAGSFGAVVWIFQEGNLFIDEGRPIEPSLPILLFCVLFGLSMDYELLMLSRIKESYERTGDNARAVAEGLAKSAGLITSAALIMVVVFSAFALARVVLIQAVGFGMALAVAIDATLVRVLLVPSTMRLLGHLNWWAPAPLLALRRRLGPPVTRS